MYLNTYTNVVTENLNQCSYIKLTATLDFKMKEKNFIEKFKPSLNKT